MQLQFHYAQFNTKFNPRYVEKHLLATVINDVIRRVFYERYISSYFFDFVDNGIAHCYCYCLL